MLLGKAYAKPIEMKAPKTTTQPQPPSGGPATGPASLWGGIATGREQAPGAPWEALKNKSADGQGQCWRCSPGCTDSTAPAQLPAIDFCCRKYCTYRLGLTVHLYGALEKEWANAGNASG